jgi:hypothetical protein
MFGEPVPVHVVRLRTLIDAGTVGCGFVPMPKLPEERWTGTSLRLPDGTTSDPFTGRTQEHRILCARAAIFLDVIGLPWRSGRSLLYPGGDADVLSEDARVAVECGNTLASKVVQALLAGWSVLVVPYPGDVGKRVYDMLLDPIDGFMFDPQG